MVAQDVANDRYLMAIKDEQGGQKNIRLATSASALGPWSTSDSIVVGPGSGIEENATEGPSLLKIDDTWFLYYDAYGAGYLGVATTNDSDPTNATWENVTAQSTMPVGPNAHHGTVFAAPIDAIAFDILPFSRSDLSGDELINLDDWLKFSQYHLSDLSELDAPLYGDLDGDGDNDFTDFRTFQKDYDAYNGNGSFQLMLSSLAVAVPEPSNAVFLTLGYLWCFARRGRRSRPSVRSLHRQFKSNRNV